MYAVIKTEKGVIHVDLFKDVPETVNNFIMHAKMGYYNNTSFYRVENFCIQAGNKNPEMKGNYIPQFIKHEINYHRNGQYSVAMADAGIGTATTHFYINKEENSFLDRRYIVFGQVVQGNKIIQNIKKGDKIFSIEII